MRQSVLLASTALAVMLGNPFAPAWAKDGGAATARGSGSGTDKAEASNSDIIVTGTRASLQSAIARKRNAGTVVDSVVAEDISSFPDKNVGEALSRITGVQLSRDFGEGVQVSIRGVEPELNRVEVNGVSQQSAQGERGGDFRELQVELVKSIDVWKGYTVDLTEGGIGGTVSVETRRPLEIVKPIFIIKAEAQRLDLAQNWRPRLNLTAGRSDLLGGRLGVLVNVTHNQVETRQDYMSNTNWNRIADFDRSSEKTMADPNYAGFDSYESCAGVTGASATAATANRLACEKQFFDWAPTIARYRTLDRSDKRTSADFQAQFKVSDNFNIWGEYQLNERNQQLRDVNYSLNADRYERFNFDPALATNAAGATSRPRITPGTFTIDEDTHVVTSWTSQVNGLNVGTAAAPVYNGANNSVGVQRRDFSYDQNSRYAQVGFNWDLGRLKMVGFGSSSKARLINNTNLVSMQTSVGGITIDRRNDLGIPLFIFPTSFDPSNPSDYADFTRTGANGQLLVQNGPSLQYRPEDKGSSEKQLKLDIDYDTRDLLPFFSKIEIGGQYRDQSYYAYGGGGARLLQSAVAAVPGAGIPGSPAIFQDSANVSLSGVVGPVPAGGPAANTIYFTQDQFRDFVATNVGITGGAPLFTGLSGAPEGAPERFAIPLFDREALSRYFDLSGFDQDLVRKANGLPQIPAYVIGETISAGYLKFNFDQDLWGMKFSGNFGLRYVHTKDTGTSSNTRRETRIRPGTGQIVNGVLIPAVVETVTTAVQEISLSNSYTDWLPAINLSLEPMNNLYFRATYAKNMARPKVTDLSPSISCTFDQTDTLDLDDVCSAGNPELKPYRADQYDLNLAWYPNADTMVSLGYYYKDIKSFILPAQTRTNVDLFQDGVTYTVRQPINGYGAKLDGFEFSAQTVFSFLPAPFDGMGVSGNFTYSRALNSGLTNQSTGEKLSGFPGLSKFTYNARIFYDKDWLQASLSYNRRSSWLRTAADSNNANNPVFRRGETFIDAKVLFRLTDNWSLWVEALNLGKEYSATYIDAARPIEYYYPGRRLFLGAQLKL
ncbi:MAG: TonB-dependent receptor [Luteolibacter sp.]